MLDWLRRLAGSADRQQAFREERASLAQAAALPAVDPRFADEMRVLGMSADGIHVGTSVPESDLAVHLRLDEVIGTGHTLVLGGTHSGKTRVVAGVLQELLRRSALAPGALGVWVIDHKSELVELIRTLIAELIEELPAGAATGLLDRLVVIDPFSTKALVPLQILRPEPGVPAEVQAFEVTTAINRLGGAELGVRQDSFLFHLVLLGITRQMTLPELAGLLSDPVALSAAAAAAPSSEVQAFFSGGPRVANTSLEGVRARLHRLLRLPSTRLMLGAKDCVSFHELLAKNIVLIDVGSPPLGCEDLARFWSGLVTLKTTRAMFERTPAEATRPVMIAVDEWQEGLAAGGEMADHYERVLSMARSRGISLVLVSQSLAGAARVSSSLPKVVATNTSVQLLFRASPDDARSMAHLLPVTGRRQRPSPAPWEERSRSPYLSANEELQLLTAEVSSLPDRTFYLWNRRRPYRASLVRARDVNPRVASFQSAELTERLEVGSLAIAIRELEAQVRGDAAVVFRPLGTGGADGGAIHPAETADEFVASKQAALALPLGLPGRRPRRRKGP